MRTKRVWVLGAIVSCLAIQLCAGPSLAAEVSPPTDAATADSAAAVATTQRSGTFEVESTLLVSPTLPNGTQITAFANAQVSDTKFFGNVSIQGVGTVSGGKVSFKLLMPYIWLVASTADKVTVQLTVTGSASGAVPYSDQAFLSQTIALPKNGATTPVIFIGSL